MKGWFFLVPHPRGLKACHLPQKMCNIILVKGFKFHNVSCLVSILLKITKNYFQMTGCSCHFSLILYS